MQTLTLHVGAHKTATTHLQKSLEANRDLLAKSGSALLTPREIRAGKTTLQDRLALPFHPLRTQEVLDELRAPHSHLLISEENALRAPHPWVKGAPKGLYPWGVELISMLAEALPDQAITVALAVRDYAGFYRSFYAQMLLAGRTITFEEFLAHCGYPNTSWRPLIEAFSQVTTVDRLLVWDYADYPSLKSPILEALCPGIDPSEFIWSDGRAHEGLSERAVMDVLTSDLGEMPKDGSAARQARAKIAKDARKRFPISPDWPVFDPWSREEKDASLASYEADLAEIAKLPKVEILTP